MSPYMNEESSASAYEISADKKSIPETTERQVEVQDEVILEDGLRRGLLGRHITLISLSPA
jgi:amino acid transporter